VPPEPEAPASAWEPPAAEPSRPIAPRSPRSLRVAGVVGGALRAQLDPECSLFTFGPNGWTAVLEDAQPHLLLVESDTFANDGSWQAELGTDAPGEELRRLVAWCRAREIPTAFWNTTDPLGFDRWLAVAGLFDNVFTVDADAVARYAARGAIATANVAPLPACVQPRAFGSASAGRAARACFVLTEEHTADARAWSETRAMLAAAKDLVDVYAVPGLAVPDGMPVDARELSEPLSSLFRRYAVALSTPARGDATGKVPQRVLEMLASGIAVAALASPDVSLHLAAVVETFGGPEAVAGALHKLIDDEVAQAHLASQGELFVLRSHTPMDLLATLASAAGIKVDADAERRVAALVLADTADDASIALRALAAQSRPADEIIVGTKARPADLETTAGARIRIVRQEGDARPQLVRELARMASTPWVYIAAPAADPDSLEQLVLRAPFAGADAVARAADEVAPVVVRRDLVAERGWPDDPETLRRWAHEGLRIHTAG